MSNHDSQSEQIGNLHRQITDLQEANTRLLLQLRESQELASARLETILVLADFGARIARELANELELKAETLS